MQKADEKLYMDEPDWQLLNPLINLNIAKIGKTRHNLPIHYITHEVFLPNN